MLKTYLIILILLAILALSPVTSALCQEKDTPKDLYLASTIPDSLKENANSVVRLSSTNMAVNSPGNFDIKFHGITTILNEKADNMAVIYLQYNKAYNTYSSIQIVIYAANGDVIKKYHKSDMYDGAAVNNDLIVTDERFLGLRHSISSYPVTIELEYEQTVTSCLDLRRWEIQKDQQSVQSASYHVTVIDSVGFRYLNKNINISPKKEVLGNVHDYTWVIKNLKAIKLEDHAEPWRVFPAVYFGANKFKFYGEDGDFSSWKNFGKWIDSLNNSGALLSPERAVEIREMTDTIKTENGKARFLYNYLQQNMRYVNIQLGMGGLKPFPAMFVDQKRYGDCKALSNYMRALLNAVGIKAYYAIVNAEANKEPANPLFPFNYFNHIILCIPFKADTTWLECTNSQAIFGKPGTFTENRYALLVTEDGGKLVKTPTSKIEDNQFNSSVHLTLDADGGAKASIKILSSGVYRDDEIGISSLKLDDQKKAYSRLLNIKQPIVFDINSPDDHAGLKELDLNLEYDKFCDMNTGDMQFYKPLAFDLVAFTVPVNEHRKFDYYFESPVEKSCVTIIDIPTGFEIETLPANQSLKFTYGSYDIKYVYDAAKKQVTSTSTFILNNQVIPAAKYTEMQEYLDAVAKAQNKKLVIKRKA